MTTETMTETRTAATIAATVEAEREQLAALERQEPTVVDKREQTERDYAAKLAAGEDGSALEAQLIRLETQVRGIRRAVEDKRAHLAALEGEHKEAERREAEEHVRATTAAAVAAGEKLEQAVQRDRGIFAALDALREPEQAARDAEHGLEDLTGRTAPRSHRYYNEFWLPRRRLLALRTALESYRDGHEILPPGTGRKLGRALHEEPGAVSGRRNMAFL